MKALVNTGVHYRSMPLDVRAAYLRSVMRPASVYDLHPTSDAMTTMSRSRQTQADELTFALFARRILRGTSAEDASSWAVAELQRGRETDGVLILAGLGRNASPWEVDHYLSQALEELGWDPPSRVEALTWLAADLAERILSLGDAPPNVVYPYVRDVARLCMELGYPDQLLALYSLEDDFDLFDITGESSAAWAADVREEAQRLVDSAAFFQDEDAVRSDSGRITER